MSDTQKKGRVKAATWIINTNDNGDFVSVAAVLPGTTETVAIKRKIEELSGGEPVTFTVATVSNVRTVTLAKTTSITVKGL